MVLVDVSGEAAYVEERVFLWHKRLSQRSFAWAFCEAGPHRFIARDADLMFSEHNAIVQSISRQMECAIRLNLSLSGLAARWLKHDGAKFKRLAVVENFSGDGNHLGPAVAA